MMNLLQICHSAGVTPRVKLVLPMGPRWKTNISMRMRKGQWSVALILST